MQLKTNGIADVDISSLTCAQAESELQAILFLAPRDRRGPEFKHVRRRRETYGASVFARIGRVLQRNAESNSQPLAIELIDAKMRICEPRNARRNVNLFGCLGRV